MRIDNVPPAVEIWNEFSQRWTSGFVVVEIVAEGFVVRRAGDRTPVPTAIPAGRVRLRTPAERIVVG